MAGTSEPLGRRWTAEGAKSAAGLANRGSSHAAVDFLINDGQLEYVTESWTQSPNGGPIPIRSWPLACTHAQPPSRRSTPITGFRFASRTGGSGSDAIVAAGAIKQPRAARPPNDVLAWAAGSAGATPPATAC